MARADDEELELLNNADIPSAIPDGDQYEVSFVRWEKAFLWGHEKLFLWFVLQTHGPWINERFYMVCKVASKGKWTPSSKFWRMWVLANGKQPARHDRLSTKVFRNKIFRARIRKVMNTSKQHIPRTFDQQYSVIDELLEVKAGC